MKQEKFGICAICGEYKKLTFEHVPPKAAFNDQPIFIQTFTHLFEKESYVYGKRKRSNRGFGDYTLCKPCNNHTGDWYVRDFADFAIQGMNILKTERQTGEIVIFDLIIKPLNVFKEIIAMFMSADKSGALISIDNLKEFVLSKELKKIPKSIDVYMYCTLSPYKKFIGYQLHGSLFNEKIDKLSEINFQPFGYVLTVNSLPPPRDMVKITSFKGFEYNETKKVKLNMPYLKVSKPMIGHYEE